MELRIFTHVLSVHTDASPVRKNQGWKMIQKSGFSLLRRSTSPPKKSSVIALPPPQTSRIHCQVNQPIELPTEFPRLVSGSGVAPQDAINFYTPSSSKPKEFLEIFHQSTFCTTNKTQKGCVFFVILDILNCDFLGFFTMNLLYDILYTIINGLAGFLNHWESIGSLFIGRQGSLVPLNFSEYFSENGSQIY